MSSTDMRAPEGAESAPEQQQAHERQVQGKRAPYSPPTLARLGAWQAVTLQQSVPIFP